jgi:hypothetical protein
MDIQFWIWLAIIAVSFIARAMKKKEVDPADSERPGKEQPLGPVSFEDLLREIQASKAPEPKVKTSQPAPQRSFDSGNQRKQERAVLENVKPFYISSEQTKEVYENAKAAAFSGPSLEETMRLEDTVVRYDRSKQYGKQEQSVVEDFVKELNDPDKLKRAFVLNEVLMRKF